VLVVLVVILAKRLLDLSIDHHGLGHLALAFLLVFALCVAHRILKLLTIAYVSDAGVYDLCRCISHIFAVVLTRLKH